MDKMHFIRMDQGSDEDFISSSESLESCTPISWTDLVRW